MVSSQDKKRLLLVANDYIGERMAGPAIRYVNFARELSHEFAVTLLVPNRASISIEDVTIVEAERLSHGVLAPLAREHDVVVAQQLHLRTMRELASSHVRVVYDLYDPFLAENLALLALSADGAARELEYRLTTTVQEMALATGDAFICASEAQRDLWVGVLSALRRLDFEHYDHDPTLRDLIDVVPFGLEARRPRLERRVLKGVAPGIGDDDRVLVWGGGIWNWFDPLTVIRAVALLRERRRDVKLVFLGMRDPNPRRSEPEMSRRAVALARELGVHGTHVFFNDGWVPYAERQNYLLEADLGVSAHYETIEARFAYRTRLLDYFWARLPTVTTRGDVLGDLVLRRRLGRAVGHEDVDGWVAAIEELLDDEGAYREAQANLEPICEELAWPRVVAPLARLARSPGRAVRSPRALAVRRLSYQTLRARGSLARRGVRGSVETFLRLAGERVTGR